MVTLEDKNEVKGNSLLPTQAIVIEDKMMKLPYIKHKNVRLENMETKVTATVVHIKTYVMQIMMFK